MAEEYLTKGEHDEFAKRMEETNTRQNKRIEILEESVKDINRLATSIEKIAINQEHMIKEQTKQGEMLEKQNSKIEAMEKEPIQTVKDAKKKVIDTVVTVVATALVMGLIMLVASYV